MLTSTQLTWANAHTAVPANSTAAIFNVEPIGTRMLLSTESTLLLGRDRAAAGRVDRRRRQGTPHDRHRPGARPALPRAAAGAADADLDRRRRARPLAGDGRPAHGDGADGVRVRADALLHDGGAPRRRLRDAGAADPVVGDRAGRGPVRRPRRRPRGHAQRRGRHVRPARRRRRRDERARGGRRGLDADRGRARAQGRRPAAPERARVRRHHALRRQGPVHTGRPGRSGSRRAVQVTGHVGGGR